MRTDLANWVREYDWQMRRQGEEPAVYYVERWRSPLFRRLRRRAGVSG